MSGEIDVSGSWLGAFSYYSDFHTTDFSARLSQINLDIIGETEEPNSASEGSMLTATLRGLRSGVSVSWNKTYDGKRRSHYFIRYEGDLSADGLEISGVWSIPSATSGTFLMIRAPGWRAEQARKAEQEREATIDI